MGLSSDPTSIEVEIADAWRRATQSRGWTLDGLALPAFRGTLSDYSQRSVAASVQGLQPWLAVYELAVLWLTSANIVLSRSSNPPIPDRRELFVPWALIGTSASYAVALRSLVMQGLDSPARSLLRTLTETVFLCLAALDDPKLAEQYSKAETPEDVKTFWHKTASPKNLHQRVIALERRLGFEESHGRQFQDWRTQEHAAFSEAVHPSFVGSVMTVMMPTVEGEETFRFGVLGHATPHSIRTLSFAARTVWHFSLIGGLFLFDGFKGGPNPLFALNLNDPVHQVLVVAREVLSHVTLEAWKLSPEA